MAKFQDYLDPYQLSQASLPIMLKDEAQYQQEDKLSIYFGDNKQYNKGKCILTTHRILWTDGNQRHALHLKHIKSAQAKSGFIGSPKLIINLNDREVVERPKYNANNPSNHSILSQPKITYLSPPHPGYLMLSFHSSSSRRDEFLSHIERAIKQKNWINIEEIEAKEREKERMNNQSKHSSAFGIRSIIQQQERKQAKNKQMVSQAFEDLDALMTNAKKMVYLANRLASANTNLEKKESGGDNDSEQAEFDNMLQNLGIVSPITKETAGSEYHSLLARQLSDFMLGILEKNGGMMSLTDIYCIFNRARGSEMVSPDDLLMASKQMERLKLPMKLKRFEDTGVLIIELSNAKYNDLEIAKRICQLIQQKGPINELGLSTMENISVNVAREQLLQAEMQEFLCRDDSVDSGLRFYVNFFSMYEDILDNYS